MYPSSNIDSPFESLFIRSFSLDQDPSPNLDDPSLFFQFPSPFLDENELFLNQMLSQNLPIGGLNYIANEKSVESSPEKAITPSRKRNRNRTTPLKRTRKKDRHSKISTAQGVRDRRMRLSIQVAQRFFHVQDLLGYDKASTTIDWLFRKSKKAIKDLCKNKPKEKLISSTIDELMNECIENSISTGEQEGDVEKNASLERKKNEKKPRQSVYRPNLRESREKARARARDRTREKMIIKGLENSNKGFESNPNQFSDVGMIEKFLGNSSSNSWPISDDFNSNMIMEFLGNWDVNCDRINSEMTSMIPFAGNPNSVDDLVTSDFPFQHYNKHT